MNPYDRVSYSGVTLDRYTRDRLLRVLDALGWRRLTLYQGSYHPGVEASQHTHDGGGVFDVNLTGLSEPQRGQLLAALTGNGFAAWRRLPGQAGNVDHIHAVAIGNARLSPAARAQERQWLAAPPGAPSPAPSPSPSPSDPSIREQYDDWARSNPRQPGESDIEHFNRWFNQAPHLNIPNPISGAVGLVFDLLKDLLAPLARWLAGAGVMVLVALLGAWLIFTGARSFTSQGAQA